MGWGNKFPDMKNDPSYLDPRLTAAEASLAQIALNVMSFGAKGDGVTDDTTAIQNAINSLPTNLVTDYTDPQGHSIGGLVFLPKGRYKVTSTITLKRGIRIVGVSRESTQILSFCLGSIFQYLDNGRDTPDEIVFENLSLWQDSSVVPTSGAGIEVQPGNYNSSFLKVNNVLISGTYDGILLQGGLGCAIRDSQVQNTNMHGIHLTYGGTNPTTTTSTTIQNTYCSSSVNGSGYHFSNVNYTELVGCASDSNHLYGYHLDNCRGVKIHGGAEWNGSAAIDLDTCFGTFIHGYFISNSGAINGINVKACVGTVISGHISSNADTTGYALNIIGSSSPVTLNGFTFSGNYQTNITNNKSQLFSVGGTLAGNGGLVGGFSHNWAFGADDSSPSPNTQLLIGGTAETTTTEGIYVKPQHTASSTSNAAARFLFRSFASAVTYSVVAGAHILNAVKGVGSTLTRALGLLIDEQTTGTNANANISIATASPPLGNWNIYSASTRPSVFSGPISLPTYATSARPTGQLAGTAIYDATLNKPIWYNGTNWTDATGTTV